MALALGLIWVAMINGATWLAFDHDKKAAIAHARRTPENTLLGLALLGGTPAAYYARATLRHKTRKQPFSALLHLIAFAQVVALVVFGLGLA
jgi:uncharacterized membrane protein YsdA (DUF1294 family)